jgi:hypothetical protein
LSLIAEDFGEYVFKHRGYEYHHPIDMAAGWKNLHNMALFAKKKEETQQK